VTVYALIFGFYPFSRVDIPKEKDKDYKKIATKDYNNFWKDFNKT